MKVSKIKVKGANVKTPLRQLKDEMDETLKDWEKKNQELVEFLAEDFQDDPKYPDYDTILSLCQELKELDKRVVALEEKINALGYVVDYD